MSEPASPPRGTDLDRARTIAATVKAKEAQIRLRRLEGDLVDRAPATEHIRDLAAADGAALLAFVVDEAEVIAADLDVDAALLAEVLGRHLRRHLEIRAGLRIEVPA